MNGSNGDDFTRRLPDLALAPGFRQQFKTSAALRQLTSLPVQQHPGGRCPVAHGTSGCLHVPLLGTGLHHRHPGSQPFRDRPPESRSGFDGLNRQPGGRG